MSGTADHYHLDMADDVVRGSIVLNKGVMAWPADPPIATGAAAPAGPIWWGCFVGVLAVLLFGAGQFTLQLFLFFWIICFKLISIQEELSVHNMDSIIWTL